MLETLVHDNLCLLGQLERLLDQLEGEAYTLPQPALGLAAPGAHLRHILDFYARLRAGLQSGRIDYDSRTRELLVETDPARARQSTRETREFLRGLLQRDDAPLLVRLDAAPEDPFWTKSSLARELASCASHTVHHLALIAIHLRVRGELPEEGLGVAPSTLRYWETLPPCAR